MNQYNYTIVGGGIAGLLASILLKRHKPNISVCIIESEEECGGLLRSIKTPEGYEFDYGTHILGETGVEELDEIIMPEMPSEQWSSLPILKHGNFVNGYYYKLSQLIYANALPQGILEKSTYQMLAADASLAQKANNLEDYCQNTYGKVFTESLFSPLMKKLLNAELKDLHPNTLKLFGYERLIIGPGHMMRELKKTDRLNDILGFESYNEGVSSLNNYYPKKGKGIGLWIDMLLEKAQALGVDILTNTTINDISFTNNKIKQLTTTNSEHTKLNVEKLIWTAPLFPLIHLAKLNFEPQYKPTICKIIILNFVFDRPFITHNFHVYCNDPAMQSFRITLYPNIVEEGETNGDYRCTVEILSHDNNEATAQSIADREEDILQELVTIGVVSEDALVTYRNTVFTKNGFPVYTNAFVNELERQRNCVTEQITNIKLLGKASAKSFFMADVLKEVFNTPLDDYMDNI
ncbi:FAD-dependent oxidoreductase [Paraglaciecola sp.]|nr:FAD-dependent oxidoreductase [Paraglaciecola sp.]